MTTPVSPSTPYADAPKLAELQKLAATRIRQKHDANKDGKLAYAELNREVRRGTPYQSDRLEGQDLVLTTSVQVEGYRAERKVFDGIDADKDGKLSADEMVAAYYRSEDKDGDGKIVGTKGFLGLFSKGEKVSTGRFKDFVDGLAKFDVTTETSEVRETLTPAQLVLYKQNQALQREADRQRARREWENTQKGIEIGGEIAGAGLKWLFGG